MPIDDESILINNIKKDKICKKFFINKYIDLIKIITIKTI